MPDAVRQCGTAEVSLASVCPTAAERTYSARQRNCVKLCSVSLSDHSFLSDIKVSLQKYGIFVSM